MGKHYNSLQPSLVMSNCYQTIEALDCNRRFGMEKANDVLYRPRMKESIRGKFVRKMFSINMHNHALAFDSIGERGLGRR